VLQAIRRLVNSIAATVVWVALYLMSTAFVLGVMVLAVFQPRKPARP